MLLLQLQTEVYVFVLCKSKNLVTFDIFLGLEQCAFSSWVFVCDGKIM